MTSCAGCSAEHDSGPSGAWGKMYYEAISRKAHYTLAQRGAFFTAWCEAGRVTPHGCLSRKPLEAQIGAENINFLISEGDLEEMPDGRLHLHLFEWYQKPVTDNAKRQSDWRDRQKALEAQNLARLSTSPQSDSTEPSNVTVTGPLRYAPTPTPSSSESRESYPPSVGSPQPEPVSLYPNGEHDAQDRFYELTQIRPWGKRIGRWIREYEAQHGTAATIDAMNVCAAEPEGADDLMKRVAARLERLADGARGALPAPKPVEPVSLEDVARREQARLEAEAIAQYGSIEAASEVGRQARQALAERFGHPVKRGGDIVSVTPAAVR